MALYVVAFPRFAEGDAQWIEDLRRFHDPQAALLAAHVTLVFHLTEVPAEAAAAHLQGVAAATHRFAVRFDSVALRSGLTDDDFYAYLLPGEGAAPLTALHDALCRGVFAGQLALPFEPHVTLGRSPARRPLEDLAARLDEQGLDVRAEIDELHLLEVSGHAIENLAAFHLA